MAVPCRPLNPALRRRVEQSGKPKLLLASLAGFSQYTQFFESIRSERVPTTPLMIQRLERVADMVGFPQSEIFLDEAAR